METEIWEVEMEIDEKTVERVAPAPEDITVVKVGQLTIIGGGGGGGRGACGLFPKAAPGGGGGALKLPHFWYMSVIHLHDLLSPSVSFRRYMGTTLSVRFISNMGERVPRVFHLIPIGVTI